MPSIPQSLLWISLVVLWLFVLVPMLISKRDNVRRTSDVALATRVLNGGAKSRRFKRSGPSAGHRHDPDWQPEEDQFDELDADDEVTPSRTRSVVVVAAVAEQTEPDYLDVDVVDEDSGALPVGGGAARAADAQPTLFDEAVAPVAEDTVTAQPEAAAEDDEEAVSEGEATDTFEAIADDEPQDGTADEYEYVEDTSGLEAEEEPATTMTPRAGRQRRTESTTAAAVSARKYRFRKRMLTAMAAVMVLTAVLSFTVSADLWWACGAAGAVTVLYLAYLRRQTRIEEQVRRRRQQRMARSRLGVESTEDREFDVVPSRLRRPGAAVLDIDDEDPIFEHLDEVAFARHFDLPRAAGQ
ncbi:gephyrin-like molybdotransferase receptor GlpR [Mycobacterium sp. shizuoka-1]|uniref:divisome protein SepX/GlpR n=1 Tax=Mycobacterium sp. shizuoka-1 TaxID=2039281 RepID=UPI000C0667BF|nr:gephyrin-like molybdotransferase receptor GlpR [Mycobacterium sp. shizuoka-1]GAY18730.1 membrane protein [Mycobacterium sp. shizuoka-1]